MTNFAITAAAVAAVLIASPIAVMRAGIVREESDRSLLGAPATRTASVTRRVVGLYVRAPRQVITTGHGTSAPVPARRSPGHPHTTGQYR